MESSGYQSDAREEQAMQRFFSAAGGSTERLEKPPVDALVPAHLETATFAVG